MGKCGGGSQQEWSVERGLEPAVSVQKATVPYRAPNEDLFAQTPGFPLHCGFGLTRNKRHGE